MGLFDKIMGVLYPSFRFKPATHGWVREGDHPEARWTLSALTKSKTIHLPRSLGGTSSHIINDRTPISDQFDIGSCVANAVCDGYEIRCGFEGPVWQLSRMFCYNLCRTKMGRLGEDCGTYIWLALDTLRKIGCVPEHLFPYDEVLLTQRPNLELFTLASQNKLAAYAKLDAVVPKDLGDQIELCIRNDCPVVFGTEVNDAFVAYRGAETVIGSMRGSGRHAMLFTGVRYRNGRREFLGRNSWSRLWGMGGYFWASEELATRSPTMDHHVILHGVALRA